MKVSEASGHVLDWMVAKAEGLACYAMVEKDCGQGGVRPLSRWCAINLSPAGHDVFAPSVDWSQGGPIIEREFIGVVDFMNLPSHMRWRASTGTPVEQFYKQHGSTALIAAMRCFVVSKLGDEVEVPKELL